MDKKLYESEVAAAAAKRFRMLCEYTFNITEDDGEDNTDNAPQDNTSQDEAPMNATPQDGAPDMSGANNMGDTPQDGSMGDAPQGGPMGNAPQDGPMGDTPQEGAPGFNPQEGNDMPIGEPSMNDAAMQSDDEVIDVDDLTKSQEETEDKVDDIQVTMEKGFEKLLGVVSKLNKMIDDNSTNMEALKQELEKRNPTALEKLNMRAVNDSYPFNVSPSEFWSEKEANSNYRVGGDNEESEQYTITQGDIDRLTDYHKISQDLNSSEYNQDLRNIFGLR